MSLFLVLATLFLGSHGVSHSPRASSTPTSSPVFQPTTGRIVVKVTTLDGTVEMSGMQVELRQADDSTVLAKTLSDEAGQVTFPDIPPGRYTVTASRPGFEPAQSAAFDVRANEIAQVLLDTQLSFLMPPVEVQGRGAAPTDSVQPVSTSDMLSGSVLESAPLEGDDFQSLLPLLPGVVRGADGRLRIKGGQPSQGALQVSSASLIDPSTGDFDLELPGQSRRVRRSPVQPLCGRVPAASPRASRSCGRGAAPTTGSSSRATSCRGSGSRSPAFARSSRASRFAAR